MRVGVTTSSFAAVSEAPLNYLRERGCEIIPNPYGRRLTRDEAMEFVTELDGLVAGLEPLDRGVLEGAGSLRAIARVGIGTDNVDLAAAAEKGIAVSNTPEPPTAAVAELTMTAMLSLVRGFVPSTLAVREGNEEKWNQAKAQITQGLVGASVLLVGIGRIGRRVADLLEPFGAEVRASDPNVAATDVPANLELVDLAEGLAWADVVSLHASGRDCLIGSDELSLMKPGAILLNAARGELVDEEALGHALQSGALGAAWFDAFWEEPYEGSLAALPNFFGTPHVGTYTEPCRVTMEMEAVENLARDLGIE